MKNATQTSVSFLIALLSSILLLFFLLVTKFSFGSNMSWSLIVFFVVLFFVVTQPLAYLTLEIFVFSKIKLIDKILITQPRATKSFSENNTPKDTLESVKNQVIELSLSQSKEIDELKQMEQYRKDFLGNVSHELKTPLFNIQGYLETLLDGGLEDKKINRNYLEKSAQNADRLQHIVEDLLHISQYESSDLTLDVERFDIHQLTLEIFENFDMQARARNIEMQLKGESDHSIFVEADRVRVTQVLNNLISNAIKYGREGGYVSVGFYDNGDLIVNEVSDNGPGIEQKHLSRLFERFYRVDKARSREQGGTGLGLSIVKHIVEAHKQNITVRSTVGIGTTFSFSLKKAK